MFIELYHLIVNMQLYAHLKTKTN